MVFSPLVYVGVLGARGANVLLYPLTANAITSPTADSANLAFTNVQIDRLLVKAQKLCNIDYVQHVRETKLSMIKAVH